MMPVNLHKGEGGEDWRIEGLASTPTKDLQDEIVKQDGLDISDLKAGRGLFNFDHKEGPENLLGIIEDANVTNDGLHVSGYLFKHQPRAKAFYDIMRSLKPEHKKRVQMSIEGRILERGGKDGKTIKSAKVEKVALTVDPVNRDTFTTIAKSLSGVEEKKAPEKVEPLYEFLTKLLVLKALSATNGYAGAPRNLTSGGPLTGESLDSKDRDLKGWLKSRLDELKKECPGITEDEFKEAFRESFGS